MKKDNNMFRSTRLKLTTWYLLIIMFISFIFSTVIYAGINRELNRIQHMQEVRERFFQGLGTIPPPGDRPESDPQVEIQAIADARMRLIITLVTINIVILLLSGGAGYFLAGRTLEPIKIMLDEQNRFITDASHELKTPLTALRSEIEVYFLGENHTLKDADHILKSNLEEVITLQELSEDLMRLVKYNIDNNDTNTLFLETLPLQEIISGAVKRVTPLAKKKNIILESMVGEVFIKGEKQNLQKLFITLLDNAIKYSPEKTTVSINTATHDHSVLIHIKDQGIGILEKDIPHIFDRFYRADQSRSKTEISGYGLGLSIAQQIVQMHHGTLTVKSTPKKGTVFTVQLPIIPANRAA